MRRIDNRAGIIDNIICFNRFFLERHLGMDFLHGILFVDTVPGHQALDIDF